MELRTEKLNTAASRSTEALIRFTQNMAKNFVVFAIALYFCSKANAASTVRPPQGQQELVLTASNSITFAYVDNVRQFPLPNAADWGTVDRLPIDTYARLVTVRASNLQSSCSGLLVSINNHPTGYSFLSDNKWVCSANPESGWEYIGFDDSSWTPAYQVARNGVFMGSCVWSPIMDIPDSAYWIWTSDHTNGDRTVSCRGYTPICDYSPCLNGGTCNKNSGNLCTCPFRWGGHLCEIDLSECSSEPCTNGGTCSPRVNGGYQCECSPYFSGSHCEIDLRACNSNPCLNGGSCILDVRGGYHCTCSPGYTGFRCEIYTKVCDTRPCLNGGTCIVPVSAIEYYCDCAPGFSGSTCQTNINDCANSPCQNRGICHDSINGFYCECPPNVYGYLCECTGYHQTSDPPIVTSDYTSWWR